ncbi:unnamed protein product, partial [Rotaria socialis]
MIAVALELESARGQISLNTQFINEEKSIDKLLLHILMETVINEHCLHL